MATPVKASDIKAPQSAKDRLLARFKERYPDHDASDEDWFYGQINDDYDNYDATREGEKKLSDLMTKDPRSAAFLVNWSKGEDPVVQLVRQFGPEIADAVNDPARMNEIAEANKKRLEMLTEGEKLEKEFKKNFAATCKYLDEYQQREGLSDDEMDETMAFLVGISQDALVGKFSPQAIDMARKALTHDADVASADMEGEVRGRNAKIDERLRKAGAGDGTARLSGQNRNGGGGDKLPSLGALDRYGEGSGDIWERGGMKRVSGR